MKKVIFAFLMLSAITTYAQDVSHPNREIIADETEMEATPTGKSLKVITSNETLATRLIKHYNATQELKYNFQYKSDRHGKYPVWTFYFKPESKEEVKKLVQ